MAIDGKLIELARKSRGKSQADLAKIVNSDQTYISKVEKNKLKGGIKGDELLEIAKALEYDPLVFLGDISLDEGDLKGKKQDSEIRALRKEIAELKNKVRPIEKLDKVAERVMINQDLHDLVEMIQFGDAGMLRRFRDIAYGYVSGAREEVQSKKEGVS